MINFNLIQNLSEIQNEYECFFIDLWGVIHNGVNLFEHVLDTLKFLKNEKKSIFFLTNAPRRSNVIKKQLFEFGLSNKLYDDVVSSGEITWQKLKVRKT